ncbi:cell division protein ZapA [Clostridium acidisoli DSM 12555]|uniref:Cell division protein ZapA n=1 Tax=Clostridium acidisoli DSM 12555 TaxID=1121291 RepID=A0A1W1XAG4_9CLOT|nr:cell division protein ZapA [Clostridium acidisoli]SMC20902.1 cell division protein ZapA [Clostridium acidisoli DSM 12555]
MSSVTVRVNNKEYQLVGDEKEEYLHTVGNYVDKKIKNIMENNPKLSTSEAAILTAMNLADELYKSNEYNEKLSDEVEELKNKANSLNKEISNLNEEKEKLKSQINKVVVESHDDEKEKEIERLNHHIVSIEKDIEKIDKLKDDNKKLKFNLQSAKYKLIDLENKYLENQILLAKTKKEYIKYMNEKK